MSEVDETEQYTEAEQKAIEDGWNPDKEAVEADGKKWVSAEEFLERGSLFKKINDYKNKVENLERSMQQLNEHNRKAAEMERKKLVKEYESKIASLEKQKIQALDEEDHEAVVDIDRQLREVELPPEIDEEFTTALAAFKKNNDWYDKNVEMQDYADMIGLGYSQKHPHASPEKIFEHVEKETRARFPDRFENQERKKPSAVESDTPVKPKSKNITVKDLTQDERQVYQNFDRMNVFKTDEARQQYLREVIAMRD